MLHCLTMPKCRYSNASLHFVLINGLRLQVFQASTVEEAGHPRPPLWWSAEHWPRRRGTLEIGSQHRQSLHGLWHGQ
jgi:hypothetical protein